MAHRAKKASSRPDFTTLAGVVIALAGIVGGLVLEGGKIRDVAQITAAIIVFFGTFGAVMVSTPSGVLKRAVLRIRSILFEEGDPPDHTIEEIIGYATKARKAGLVSLEQDAMEVKDPFLRKALNHAVDGTDMQELRAIMQLESDVQDRRAQAESKVFECAGGYSPTVGIIGAVMGLIQVMKNLANIDEVGHGIAVAFVATIYGVAAANLLFLPAASKIRSRAEKDAEHRELMLEGVLSIVEGLNPKLIRSKLDAYREPSRTGKRAADSRAAMSEAAAAHGD